MPSEKILITHPELGRTKRIPAKALPVMTKVGWIPVELLEEQPDQPPAASPQTPADPPHEPDIEPHIEPDPDLDANGV